MDKNLVIKAREHFGENPIKLVCDNMIIAYDHTPNAVNLIWHDDEEYVERITPTQSDNLVGSANVSPMKNMFIPYEMIQYIEGHYDKESAVKYAEELKPTIGETQYQRVIDMIAKGNEAMNIKYITED